MEIKNIIKEIDSLLAISLDTLDESLESGKPVKIFNLENGSINFAGFENVALFENILSSIYKWNKDLENTIGFKFFEDSFVKFLIELKSGILPSNTESLNTFLENLLSKKLEKYEILYEVYGAKMINSLYKIGEYVFHNTKHPDSLIRNKYLNGGPAGLFFETYISDILVEITIEARDSDKAMEIADLKMSKLEYTLSYMLADLSHKKHIGNFHYRNWKTTARMSLCNSKKLTIKSTNEIALPHLIEDRFFVDKKNGNNQIWKLLASKNHSDLELRILQAIEWIGKGIYENDKSKSIVLFLISIECLLQKETKDVLVNPSILSYMSESCAFILGNDLKARKAIAKYFRGVYSQRSAIVHGGSKTISYDDLNLALYLSKGLIISLLTDDKFSRIKTTNSLFALIEELKYN
jgi:hypothetical protein